MLTRQELRRLHALQELQQQIRDEDAALVRLQKRAKLIGLSVILTTNEAVIFRCPGRTIHCGDLAEAWCRIALLTKEFNAIQSIATSAVSISVTA